jgi:hypothetical protein
MNGCKVEHYATDGDLPPHPSPLRINVELKAYSRLKSDPREGKTVDQPDSLPQQGEPSSPEAEDHALEVQILQLSYCCPLSNRWH